MLVAEKDLCLILVAERIMLAGAVKGINEKNPKQYFHPLFYDLFHSLQLSCFSMDLQKIGDG